jgi:membrane protein implicated in regulation of membrane protease activity
MTWWGWIISGAILLGVELVFVNAQFYLVFVGGAAIVVGVVTALTPALASWAQWAVFAALAVILMVTFRSRVYRMLRGPAQPVHAGPVGSVITVPAALAPGESCQAEHRGTFWTVCNVSDTPMAIGTRAHIAGVKDLTLLIRPDADI